MTSDERKALELLRPHAGPPPAELPPDGMPCEADAPWSLGNAARAVLGRVIQAPAPDDELFALADYLLTFAARMQRADMQGAEQHRQELALAGAALAACGYLAAEAHPEAELWRLAGGMRLATALHSERLRDCPASDCLRAVCNLAAARQAPIISDLLSLQERLWGRLVDHSRAEHVSVGPADLPAHLTNPVPPDRLGVRLAERPWQRAAAPPTYVLGLDLSAADAACENRLTLRAHMHVRHQFGRGMDWHLRLFDDKESTVSICSMWALRNLASAYARTRDAKYAEAGARLVRSFYHQAVPPNHWQAVGPWRTLEVGGRQCNTWPAGLGYLGATDAFDVETHLLLACSRLEHIRYLLAHCGGVGNWYQVESAGLAMAALWSPELRQAQAVLRVALRRLRWINAITYLPDGFQRELSLAYHHFPTSSLANLAWTARARGVDLGADFRTTLERAHEVYLHAAQPDGELPRLNDSSPRALMAEAPLRMAAELFGRDDFAWGGSGGRAGTPPAGRSHAWAHAGYVALRDGWGPTRQLLLFDVGPFGAGHQHEDKLSFTFYAGGRLLVGDPGIYSYAATPLTRYFKRSRAHNVVLIDGMGQARRFRRDTNLAPLGRREVALGPELDFVSGEYCAGFAPLNADEPAAVRDGFVHRRAIFYLPGAYAVVCDRVEGPDAQPHEIEQLFHVAPLCDETADPPIRTGALDAGPEGIVTRDAGVANLAIVPVDKDVKVAARKGETDPPAGWWGVLGEFPAWEVGVSKRSVLPARLDAVLWPLPASGGAPPTVERLRCDAGVTAFRVRGPDVDDTFVLSEDPQAVVRIDGLVFQGRALVLRRRPAEQALAVQATRIELNGRRIGAANCANSGGEKIVGPGS